MTSLKNLARHPFLPLALVLLCLALQLLLTGIFTDWWLEDDVYQREFILSCPNPLQYFFDRESAYAFNMGRTFTPMLAFTLLIDSQLHPMAPVYAYAHTAVSLLVVCLLLYGLLRKWTSSWAAALITSSWLFLPGTLVVTEFIAARHYLEGFLFSLIAYALARRYPFGEKGKNLLAMAGIVACYYVASLYKETYLVFTAFMLGVVFFEKKQWHGILAIALAGMTYTAHRLWFIQGVTTEQFTIEWKHVTQFALLPYTITGTLGGVAVFALVVLLTIYLGFKRQFNRWHWLWMAGGIGALCLPLLPVFRHLYNIQLILCSWYRLVFLVTSMIWIFGGCLLHRLQRPKLALVLCGLAIALLWPGSAKTMENFDKNKTAYEQEAMFYLENPDKLLFSEIPAAWFIGNVQSLYAPHQKPHYIDWRGLLDRGVVQDLLESHDTIWRWTPQGFAPDPELHRQLLEKNLAMQPYAKGFRKITQ